MFDKKVHEADTKEKVQEAYDMLTERFIEILGKYEYYFEKDLDYGLNFDKINSEEMSEKLNKTMQVENEFNKFINIIIHCQKYDKRMQVATERV